MTMRPQLNRVARSRVRRRDFGKQSLRVEFKGSRFRVLYNGKQLFDVEDSTFTDAGKIGLWTKADSVTLFDSVTYGETK